MIDYDSIDYGDEENGVNQQECQLNYMTVTEKQFIEMTGSEPVQDDLERTNCENAGQAGHHYCGVCPDHNKPRFICGCFFKKGN